MKLRLMYLVALALALFACQRSPVPERDRAPVAPEESSALVSSALELGPVNAPGEAQDLDPAPDVLRVVLRADASGEGDAVVYHYNNQQPGPTLRARVGDILEVELINDLDTPTTIHWHGAGAPFEMDGVPWMRTPTMPGERFTYRFQLNRAGTFWYHPHFDTAQQVDRGLYGALLVEDPVAPSADHELVIFFDTPNEAQPSHPGHGHGVRRTRWLVNGHEQPTLTFQGGDVVRARLVNASNHGYLDLRAPQLRVIASDQGFLPALQTPDRIVLGPGDRVELEWLIGREGFALTSAPYSLNGGSTLGDDIVLFNVDVDVPAEPPSGLAWPFTGGRVSVDPGAPDIVYVLTGSDRTNAWLINGESFPDVTIETLALGEDAIIEVRNLSPTEHPFHIHGNPFEVLSINDQPVAYQHIEDTVNVRIRDTLRLRLRTDNPGDWMTHCHILPHAEAGMMTVLRIGEGAP